MPCQAVQFRPVRTGTLAILDLQPPHALPQSKQIVRRLLGIALFQFQPVLGSTYDGNEDAPRPAWPGSEEACAVLRIGKRGLGDQPLECKGVGFGYESEQAVAETDECRLDRLIGRVLGPLFRQEPVRLCGDYRREQLALVAEVAVKGSA